MYKRLKLRYGESTEACLLEIALCPATLYELWKKRERTARDALSSIRTNLKVLIKNGLVKKQEVLGAKRGEKLYFCTLRGLLYLFAFELINDKKIVKIAEVNYKTLPLIFYTFKVVFKLVHEDYRNDFINDFLNTMQRIAQTCPPDLHTLYHSFIFLMLPHYELPFPLEIKPIKLKNETMELLETTFLGDPLLMKAFAVLYGTELYEKIYWIGPIAFRLKHILKLARPDLPKKDLLYELCENVERFLDENMDKIMKMEEETKEQKEKQIELLNQESINAIGQS